jgi:RNase P subunit RPR2
VSIRQHTKRIACQRCKQPMTLEGFQITEHQDGTYSVDPAVECPHDCGLHFFITRSRVDTFIPRKTKK